MTQIMHGNKWVRWAAACGAAVAALICGGTATAANLLGNPGFETPDASIGDVSNAPGAPWIPFASPTDRYTSQTVARSGSQSLKLFGPFDFIGGGVGATQKVPASPGDVFVGEIYAQTRSSDPIEGDDFGVYKIEFLNSAMGLVSGVVGGLAGVDVFESNRFDITSPQDEWTKLGIGTAPAPAGTAFANVVIVKVQLGTNFMLPFRGGSIFWDDASLGKVLTADFNHNGTVNAADLAIWKGAFNATAAGDANGDGLSDGDDLLSWQNQLGSSSATPVVGAVPEPCGVVLLVFGVVLGLRGRRRAG